MLVRPTDKWLSSIAVPNCGIISKPRHSEMANVSETVGRWLIEVGFAVAGEESSLDEQPDVPPPPEGNNSADPPKTKKSKSSGNSEAGN